MWRKIKRLFSRVCFQIGPFPYVHWRYIERCLVHLGKRWPVLCLCAQLYLKDDVDYIHVLPSVDVHLMCVCIGDTLEKGAVFKRLLKIITRFAYISSTESKQSSFLVIC